MHQKKSVNSQQPSKFVPFEILVTGRTISTSFHRVQPYKSDGKDPQQAVSWRKLKLRSFRRNTFNEPMENESDSSSHLLTKPKVRPRGVSGSSVFDNPTMDLGYDASEEGSVDEGLANVTTVQPLLFSSLVQPHVFVTCSPMDQKLEVSVYDLTLSLANTNHCITCSGGRCLPTEQDFTRPVVQTRPGEPSKLSGIPPALFTLGISSFLGKDPTLQIKFERPLKINVSPDLMQNLVDSSKSILSAYGHEEIIKMMSNTSTQTSATKPPNEDLRRISSLGLTTSQILVQAQIEEQGESQTLQLGFYGCNLKAAVGSQSFNEMTLEIELRQIVARCVRDRNYIYRLLGPGNLTLDFEASWTEDQILPIVTCQVISDSFNVYLGSQSTRILTSFSKKLQTLHGNQDDLKPNLESKENPAVPEVYDVTTKIEALNTEQHYVE